MFHFLREVVGWKKKPFKTHLPYPHKIHPTQLMVSRHSGVNFLQEFLVFIEEPQPRGTAGSLALSCGPIQRLFGPRDHVPPWPAATAAPRF
jgi:hypothetical protein